MTTFDWFMLLLSVSVVPLGILISCLRIGGQVWKTYGKHYAKSQGRLYIGTTYRLWTPVVPIVPGLLYIINGKQSFYLDEEGFEPVWKLGFWPIREESHD